MNELEDNTYYRVKFQDHDEWEIIKITDGEICRLDTLHRWDLSDIKEWHQAVEMPEETDRKWQDH